MIAFTTRPEIRGTFGVAASTHWLASAVGLGVLERGGNAFDAAVAMGFVLQVVEPHLNGPAGEVPIMPEPVLVGFAVTEPNGVMVRVPGTGAGSALELV